MSSISSDEKKFILSRKSLRRRTWRDFSKSVRYGTYLHIMNLNFKHCHRCGKDGQSRYLSSSHFIVQENLFFCSAKCRRKYQNRGENNVKSSRFNLCLPPPPAPPAPMPSF